MLTSQSRRIFAPMTLILQTLLRKWSWKWLRGVAEWPSKTEFYLRRWSASQDESFQVTLYPRSKNSLPVIRSSAASFTKQPSSSSKDTLKGLDPPVDGTRSVLRSYIQPFQLRDKDAGLLHVSWYPDLFCLAREATMGCDVMTLKCLKEHHELAWYEVLQYLSELRLKSVTLEHMQTRKGVQGYVLC